MKEAKMTIEDLAELMEKGFTTLISDISGVKSDVSGLKSDVSSLKSDVSGLKSDVSSIKAKLLEHDDEFAAIRSTLREHSRSFDVIDERYKTSEKVVDKSFLKFDNHEKRIVALEARKSM